MSTHRPHVGDIGTPFRFTCKQDSDGSIIDLSTASEMLVNFVRPNRTSFQRDLEVVDADAGLVRYITVAGDLDMPGRWKIEAVIRFPGDPDEKQWTSDPVDQRVYPNLVDNDVSS